MARTSKARPAQQPARAVALSNDDAAVDDVAAEDDDAEARRLAGIAQRKKTVASTMVYAGIGLRASERQAKPNAKKPTVKRSAKPPKAEPGAAHESPEAIAAEPEEMAQVAEQLAIVLASPPAPSAATSAAKRKRPRTHSQLISRIVDTIASQLDAIDAITCDPDRGEAGPGEAERHARAVAALARVAAELRKELEGDKRRRADDDDRSRDSDRHRDLERPRDLDELRERLSRRLDARVRRGSAVSVADDAAGGMRLPE